MTFPLNRRKFVQLAGVAAIATKLPAEASLSTPQEPLRLWYSKPAADWDEALPIGCGRLGAMIFGGTDTERLQLNEDTLCSEEPHQGNLPLDIQPEFDHVEALLRAGEYAEASTLMTKKWTGRSWPCYQPMADLNLQFANHRDATDYMRELDLSDAVSRVRYNAHGVSYTREYFASFPDRVVVARFQAAKGGTLNFRASLRSEHPTAKVEALGKDGLVMRGQVPGFVLRRTLEWVERRGEQWKYPELWDSTGKRRPFAKQVLYGDEVNGRGTFFETRFRITALGGTIAVEGNELKVEGAREAVLILSAASSYNGPQKSPSREGLDPGMAARRDLAAAFPRSFQELKARHLEDYHALFHRASINLGSSGLASSLPTDQRIARFQEGNDPSFAALYLQFARYLTISGSRAGTQALNLQGIWNQDVIPPWASGYTTNINVEMNYWPVDTLNLSECFEPLDRLITEASINGSETARSMYHRRGWVLHHNTTLWRGTQPVDNDATPSFWNMGGAWLCEHLWEHYQFTRDRAFLERSYPIIKGAAEFLSDWLVPDKNGKLVTAAGCSPENYFKYTAPDGSVKVSGVSMGPTMDIAITRQVLRNCIDAAKTLGRDEALRDDLKQRMDQLLPYQIGKEGQIQEWATDFAETDVHHRHVSHLYGVYPDHQITSDTPELMTAVKRTLERRGDEGTGWSRAWKICLWARLGDGNHAYRLTSNLFQLAKSSDAASERGGLMPNMFCSCPPMQIDGNFGGAAGIAEMLLQSQHDTVHLLPALPDAWPDGSFHGFRTRAGCTVSATWKSGKLVSAQITSLHGGSVNVVHSGKSHVLQLKPAEVRNLTV
jgi:alpha-L-fucosidase 2